jgi:hypothetical protein
MSLLKMIGSGVLVFSDFTSILSKNPMSSAEILGQLRLVYDGTFIKQTGVGKIEWKGKMGVLAASTPDVYHKLEEARSMGERFGYYIMEQPNDEEIALKQEEVNMSSKDISLAMQPFYREYFVGIKAFKEKHGVLPLTMTTEQKRRLRKATQLSVLGKATVHLNKKSGKVDQIPNKAGVGRDNKMAEASLHAFQLMDAYENDNPALPLQDERIELIEKMTYSSLSRERRKVLEILAHAYTDISASKIGTERGLGLDKDSVELYLTPLHAVGLIKKVVAGSMHTWRIADKATKEFVLRVSAGLDDDIPQSTDEEDIKNDLADQIKAQIEDQWEKEF